MKKVFRVFYFLLFIILFTGCVNNVPKEDIVNVEKVEVIGENVVIDLGEEYQLNVKIYPLSITNKNIEYESSDDSVATVNDSGIVEGVSVGNVDITVTVDNIVDIISIEVKDIQLEISNVPTRTLEIGEEVTLTSNKDVTWSSNNNDVASIDSNGLLIAKSSGKATIAAWSSRGVKSFIVNVSKLEISNVPTKDIIIGEEFILLTNIDVIWTTSDDSVATVSKDGVVTTVSTGEVTITAKSQMDVKSISLIVKDIKLEVTGVKNGVINVGEELELIANKKVTWTSSNLNIASISSNGIVTGISAGEVTITATFGKETVSVSITVKDKSYSDAPISQLYEGMLPSIGNPKTLVLMIQFPDKKFSSKYTQSSMDEIFFGNGNQFETVSSFYYKSSYGNLLIDGDVLPIYTTKNYSSYYENKYDYYTSDAIIKEAIKYYDSTIDYSIYDSNNDGYIDNIYAIYSINFDYESDVWWAYNTNFDDPDTSFEGTDLVVDDVYVNNYVWASAEFLYEDDYTGRNITTFIHETGHSLGLDDYYDYYENIGPKGGLGGADLMDATIGDHNSFSKYLLGWVDPIVVDLSKITETTHTIESFVKSGDFILITNDSTKGIFSEYILVEYYTPDSLNNSNYFFNIDGIRIFHVNAQLGGNTGEYYTEFRYDNSDESKKLIKLIEADGRNDIEKSIREDDRIASDEDLFQINDSYQLVINSNFILTVNAINASNATIIVTRNK